VELLEGYRYAELVDLVMAAKRNLPLERPVHLFGAGHPMTLALAVAMGCDLFDSAAYILYARDGRYMSTEGTIRVNELSSLPCECPVCVERSADELKNAPPDERTKLIARHNLHVTFGEIRRIRQAIAEGRLWEFVELRCRTHPRLLDGLRRLVKNLGFIERFDPVTKPSAFCYTSEESSNRPEVLRHMKKLEERYEPPPLPTLAILPFQIDRIELEKPESTHILRLVPPFGVVPEELDEIYPLRQFQVPQELDAKQIEIVVKAFSRYLERYGERYKKVLLFNDEPKWGKALIDACYSVKEKLEVTQL
jgi:7-cyano-7-deazaguanine tRNA-ribosyltransferase